MSYVEEKIYHTQIVGDWYQLKNDFLSTQPHLYLFSMMFDQEDL